MNAKFESFCHQYPTEQSCYDELFAIKWPDGFVCPRCSHHSAYIIRSRRQPLYECRSCRHQTTLTADTVLERSRLPLRKWLFALQLWSDSEQGMSASVLSLELHITYKTAWSMLHKIRQRISKADSCQPLTGHVLGEFAFIGRPHNYSFDLHPKEHPVVMAASLDAAGVPLYLKIKRADPAHIRHKTLTRAGVDAFTDQNTDPHAKVPPNLFSELSSDSTALPAFSSQSDLPSLSSKVSSDSLLSVDPSSDHRCSDLSAISSIYSKDLSSDVPSKKAAISRKMRDCSDSVVDISRTYFRLYRNKQFKDWRNSVRTWLQQTFHGIGRKYLQLYLDEFCYRLNGQRWSRKLMKSSSALPLSRITVRLCLHSPAVL